MHGSITSPQLSCMPLRRRKRSLLSVPVLALDLRPKQRLGTYIPVCVTEKDSSNMQVL